MLSDERCYLLGLYLRRRYGLLLGNDCVSYELKKARLLLWQELIR
jgi:hypothetical protein